MRELKLGSLFSGSGAFELAGVLNGITPVWASEVEPFCIRVTKLRFPDMVHLGSVKDVNGAEVEPVDVITFGSPCQDLSVAGKQLGIHEGQRSSLFFEAIRIIKEMRDATTNKFPRFAVWENVPGAFGSNKGKDFQAVLQAFCKIGGGYEDIVPMPPNGKWLPAGCIVGNGWSLAWRVLNAEFFGVPQRRRRIYLIADFGSERAGEILAECKGLRWDSSEGFKAWKEIAVDATRSAGRSDSAVRYVFKDREGGGNGGKGLMIDKDTAYTLSTRSEMRICYPIDSVIGCDLYNGKLTGDKAATLNANSGASANRAGPSVLYKQDGYAGYSEGIGTMKASGGDAGGGQKASLLSVYDARGNGDGATVPTLTGDHGNRITDYTAIVTEETDE